MFWQILYAPASTRKASFEKLWLISIILFLKFSSRSTTFPFINACEQTLKTSSTPPLRYMVCVSPFSQTHDISFLFESKGISKILEFSLSRSCLSKPFPNAKSQSAVSVGSPTNLFSSLRESLQSVKIFCNISKLFCLFASSSSKTSTPMDMRLTVIWFFVSVPVLSEQITSQHPNVSTACNLFTIARRFASFETPSAIMIVTTAGKLSGIAATASATEVMNALKSDWPPRKNSSKNVTTATPKTTKVKIFPTDFNEFWSGVASVFVSPRMVAIFPTSVSMPVATTIPSPLP